MQKKCSTVGEEGNSGKTADDNYGGVMDAPLSPDAQ
jgi:hypothetical protein